MTEFPADDRRVYDAYIAGRQSAALAAGVRCGLFDLLDRDGPVSGADLAQRLDLAPRPTEGLLACLAGMGLLLRSEQGYRLSEDSKAYLVRGRPGSLWALIDMEVENFLSPASLLEALRTGRPSVYGDQDPWDAHGRDSGQAEVFTRAMHSVSERPAAGLAELCVFGSGERVLDVGGGSGALSIAICRENTGVQCTVFDLEPVCRSAAEFVEEAGLSDRVTTAVGDFFAPEWPVGHDTVLLSQILHDWSLETGRELLERAFRALPSGGRVLIHEKLVRDDDTGPLANLLVHLDMAVWTEGQQYRASDAKRSLESVGFGEVSVQSTVGYWSVVEARKP
ncbi:MAG: methyltransferase [Planctomycetota bacterium]